MTDPLEPVVQLAVDNLVALAETAPHKWVLRRPNPQTVIFVAPGGTVVTWEEGNKAFLIKTYAASMTLRFPKACLTDHYVRLLRALSQIPGIEGLEMPLFQEGT